MNKIVFLLLVFTSVSLAQVQSTQDIRPTPEQCTADLHAWCSTRLTDAKSLPYHEIETRIGDLTACEGEAIFNKDDTERIGLTFTRIFAPVAPEFRFRKIP